jgi:HK97 family phage major capsid protein
MSYKSFKDIATQVVTDRSSDFVGGCNVSLYSFLMEFDVGKMPPDDNLIEGMMSAMIDKRAECAFFSGNGVGKPRGFLTYDAHRNEDRRDNSIGYVDCQDHVSHDCIINLIYALGADYRANAAFVMNSKTAGAVRKMKDADGRFLWSDGLAAGEPARLMGYPVLIAEDMPDIGANGFPVAFGDFKSAYTVAESPCLKISKGKHPRIILAEKFIGGAVTDFCAIKLLRA